MPQLIIISGNGRNSGKTMFACSMLEKFRTEPVVSIKVSPHKYFDESNAVNGHSYHIFEETNPETGKDSSRMLAAGAHRSFFVAASDVQVQPAFEEILRLVGRGTLMIAESGALRKYIEPAIFFILNKKNTTELKESLKELTRHRHTWVTFDGTGFDFDINRIVFRNKQWIINKQL